jgi:hypothetical protein
MAAIESLKGMMTHAVVNGRNVAIGWDENNKLVQQMITSSSGVNLQNKQNIDLIDGAISKMTEDMSVQNQIYAAAATTVGKEVAANLPISKTIKKEGLFGDLSGKESAGQKGD